LVSIQKFVLEAVSCAIKDLPPSNNLESHCGHLLALADLFHRLLTIRFNAASNKQQDENTTHISKVMLEKNFVSTLTTALSEINLNYPNIHGLFLWFPTN
jgi:E3 ubiquitin-protein ligase HUWE1